MKTNFTGKELKDLKKALQYKTRYTALEKCYTKEMRDAVIRHFDRNYRENYHPDLTVREFCKELINRRGNELVRSLPDEDYSMGSVVSLYVNKYLRFTHDRTSSYANSCKYRPKHGSVRLSLTFDEFKRAQVIGGVLTILPKTNRKLKKGEWFEGKGSKQYFQLQRVQGWIYEGYHSTDRGRAIAGGKRNIELRKKKEANDKAYKKALRRQYSFADSVQAGNCAAGTRAFVQRCGLDAEKKYRGSFIVQVAEKKSSGSLQYVNKMIKYFAQ